MKAIPLQAAREQAELILGALRDYCEPGMIHIAGSIRRERAVVHDIDLVALPRDKEAFVRRILLRSTLISSGAWNLIAELPNGIQLDVFMAQPEEHNLFDVRPTNYGSLLLCRTGSTAHNIMLCKRAEKMGLHWNPYWGVYKDGACLASATEEDVFRALDLPFIEPAQREVHHA